jgi:hypothetical protein
MLLHEKRKIISDFIRVADEISLDRLVRVVEDIQTDIIGYTHSGDPIIMAEELSFLARERGVLSQDQADKRVSVLNRLKKTGLHSTV